VHRNQRGEPPAPARALGLLALSLGPGMTVPGLSSGFAVKVPGLPFSFVRKVPGLLFSLELEALNLPLIPGRQAREAIGPTLLA
jgi:hypothetical protein